MEGNRRYHPAYFLQRGQPGGKNLPALLVHIDVLKEHDMAWIIVAVVGVWIFLSAFILVIVCMNSSRISQAEEPLLRRRAYRARLSRGRITPQIQTSTVPQSMD